MAHDRLLDIAIGEFGLKGLDGASTRGIATAAGTAMSSITYHFGGKDGLYLAAADRVAAQMVGEMGDMLAAAHGIADGDRAGARALIHAIFARLIAGMADNDSAATSIFIMREQMIPSEAFERIYGGLMGRMLLALVRLVGIATGSTDTRGGKITTMLLLGQALVPRLCRASFVRLLDVEAIDDADQEAIQRRVDTHIDAVLDGITAAATDRACPPTIRPVRH